MANKTVYTLDLDTSKLINKYKGAISEMEKAGVSTDITKGLTKSLEKLEKEYQSLENAGKAGFTNSKQIESFQKKVEKLMASFRGFETELGGVSEKIGKVTEKSDKAGKKLQGAFSKLGFKDAAKAMNDVVNATDKEAKLSELVESELKDRAKAVSDLKAQYEAAAKAAEQAAAKAGNAKLGTTLNAKAGGKNIWTSGQNKPDESTRQAIAAQAEAIAKSAQDGQAAWQQFIDYLKANGLDKVFNSKAMPAVEQTIRDMQSGYAAAAPAIEAAAKAQEQLNAAEESFSRIGKQNKDGTVEPLKGAMRELSSATNEYVQSEEKISTVMQNSKASIDDMNKAQQQAATAAGNIAGAAAAEDTSLSNMTDSLHETASATEKTSKNFEQLKQRLLMFFSVTSIFSSIRNEIRKTYNDVKELDKSFASIAMVTTYGVQEMWQSYSQYADMASELGQKTNDVIKASALFYQQGLDTNEALALTIDTMKLATLADNDFETATQEMTSAIRGFKMEMDEGGRVADVYSDLAAHAAATVDDIAQAMARTASIANSAGMSFENTSAFLTQMIETTQESAENIGTSLKTIIARFTELKENVAGTSDSAFDDLEYNKVDKALKSVGVSLKDATGQFRNLDEVFLELSQKWDTLDRNTQRYVATVAAGSRQQSRFIAMMDNYDRTVELMGYAADAEGKADEQFAKYADTMEYKLNQLQTKWEEFRVNLLNSEVFKEVVDLITEIVDRINSLEIDNIFDVGKIVAGILIIGKTIKALGTSIIQNISSTVSGFKTAGQEAGKAFGNAAKTKIQQILKRNKVKINYDLQEQKINKDIQTIKARIDATFKNPIIAKFGVQQTSANSVLTFISEYKKQLKELGYSDEAAKHASEELYNELKKLGNGIPQEGFLKYKQTIDELNNSETVLAQKEEQLGALQKKRNEELQANATVQRICNAALTSGVMALSMYASGMMSGTEALKMFASSIAMQIALIGAEVVAQRLATAVTAANAKVKAMASASNVAANEAEAGSWISVWIGEVLATGGLAAYVAIVLIAIVAVAALVYAIIKLVKWFDSWADSASETEKATQALADAQERVAEAKENMTEQADEAKEVADEAKEAEKLKKEWEELSELAFLTEEQEERKKELAAEIAEKYPEIVSYYNEETGELKTQNKLWEQKIKLMNEAAHKEIFESGIANAAYYDAKENEVSAQARLDRAKIDEMNINFNKNVESDKATDYFDKAYWSSVTSSTENLNIQEYIKDWYEHSSYAKYDEETMNDDIVFEGKYEARDFFKHMAEDNVMDVEKLASYFYVGDFENATEQEYAKILQDMADESSEGWQAIVDAYKQIDETANEQQEYYEQMQLQSRSQAIQQLTGVDSAVGDAVAGAMENFVVDSDKYDMSDIVDHYDDDADEKINNAAKDWNELSQNDREILQAAGYDQKRWESLDLSNQEQTDQLKTAYENAAKEFYTQKFGEELANNISQTSQDALSDFNNSIGDKTEKELSEGYDDLIETLSKDDKLVKYLEDNNMTVEDLAAQSKQKQEEAMQYMSDLRNELSKNLGYDDYSSSRLNLGDWDTNQLEAYNNALKQIADTYGDLAAADYGQKILDSAQKLKLTPEQINEIMSIDWSQLTPDNEKEFKEKIIKQLEEAGIQGAEKMYEEVKKEAQKDGMINLTIGIEGLEEFEKKIDELRDKVQDLGDSIVSAVGDMTKNGEIAFSNFEKLSKSLSELGLSVYDYVDIDASGKITASEEKLEKLYQDQLKAQQQKLKVQIDENKVKISELKATYSLLETQVKSLETGNLVVGVNAENYQIAYEWALVMQNIVKSYDAISGNHTDLSDLGEYNINLANQDDVDKMRQAYESQMLAIKTQYEDLEEANENLTDQYENGEKWMAAAMRDHASSLLEAKGLTTDVTKAQEDYNKALDEYNDKLKNVNEKLKEYNELLYGTENRKSSLDYLYNYDEAIKSFNDEISRSKDLLNDAQTIDESTSALQRYADATHNLLVEERAKQEVLKAGLDNYADMIEKHGVSYTDNETGKQIDVNFGDYVKKDERTGKYVIDQRLINEAKFSDEWKDYLEEQVSNYNKYSEDLLTSEDNVRKAEKEIQDLRKEALKNYAAMETEIAEALKSQYEEEVNTLKDKYDAMKDADDDYLDALQDAINKQRELRDSANAYEDLAEKEKKLALMQRDTSGGNAAEVKDLEKEVEDDRQNLLDEAVDDIIDGLQELYESQQELRDTEIELKEALKDNTAFWNKKAEELAMSFDTAEEYAEYISSISKEYADMTLAQQQVKLNEYGETFTSASEYMALQAMDSTSQIGDYIVEKTTVTAEEVASTIASTAETFTTEVTRAYNETTKTFVDDMNKASEALATARAELADAYNKLCDCAAAADAAAEALRKQQELENRPKTGSYVLQYKDDNGTVIHTERISAEDYNNGDYSDSYTYWKGNTSYRADLDESSIQYSTEEIKKLSTGTTNGVSASGSMTSESKVYDPYSLQDTNQDGQVNIADTVTTMQKKARKKYATGGIVDYTGWAWVDGTPSKPEGFLNAEDTENIGNAARILADIPWLNMTSNNGNVTNNSIGGTSVVVNLNVDKITSEVDVEEMVEMVKDAVVEAANPMGTEVILKQSL